MINFDNVTLIYPYVQRTIFEGLSFEVPEGEFVLIMGAAAVTVDADMPALRS